MSIGTFILGLSPFGPIFGKELRITARKKRTYFLRVAYLLLLLVPMCLIAYAATSEMGRSRGVAAQNEERGMIGVIFFGCFSVFSVWMMGIIGPILTCNAISSERLHKTLPVLLMTPITAWQIVAGKLFSRLLVCLTLIGLGLPVLGMVRLLGGVELEPMLGVVGLAVAAAISSAAIGLFFSTLLNRTYAVILLSYGAMLFLYAFVPLVMVLVASLFKLTGQREMTIGVMVLASNPYAFACAAVNPRLSAMGMKLPWAWSIGSHFAMAGLLVFFSAMILRRRARNDGQGSPAPAATTGPPVVSAAPAAAAGATEMVELEPAPMAREPKAPGRAVREVSDNPILWREIRRPLLSRPWQRAIAIIVVGLMLLTIYGLIGAAGHLDNSESQGGWACVFNFLIAGIALVISSTAIAQEKESDTWTLILAAPVQGSTMVFGKGIGVVRRLLWPMVLVATHFFVFAVAGVITPVEAFLAVWIILSFNSIWIATGVYFSLRFSKVTYAVIANFILAISAYLLVFGVLLTFSAVQSHGRRYNGDANDVFEASKEWWLGLVVISVFAIAMAWWLWAIFLTKRRAGGAIGQLICATMVLAVASLLVAGKIDYLRPDRLYEHVGWYTPYYFLVQIGQAVRTSDSFQQFRIEMPNQLYSAPLSIVELIVAIGLAHIFAAAVLLGLTSWKFSGLVGRAPQLAKLTGADTDSHPRLAASRANT